MEERHFIQRLREIYEVERQWSKNSVVIQDNWVGSYTNRTDPAEQLQHCCLRAIFVQTNSKKQARYRHLKHDQHSPVHKELYTTNAADSCIWVWTRKHIPSSVEGHYFDWLWIAFGDICSMEEAQDKTISQDLVNGNIEQANIET